MAKMNKKETEEFGAMKADITTLKSDVKDIKGDIKHFIETANRVYATKEELCDVKKELTWSKNKIFSIAKDVAVVSAIGYLIFKTKLGGIL